MLTLHQGGVLRPGGPFTGLGKFRHRRGIVGRWSGSLAVSFLGKPNHSLTEPRPETAYLTRMRVTFGSGPTSNAPC